jgi:predicted phosphoribosyltransferase
MTLPFRDRRDAGRRLAAHLRARLGLSAGGDLLVLGLPRGGVPVAYEVARSFGAELDVLPVRKIGVPGYPELAMGALAPGGTLVINEDVVTELGIPEFLIERVAAREAVEIERRERAYRGGLPAPTVRGRTAIVVDDGLATGATIRAATVSLRRAGAKRVVVAVPTGSADTCEELRRDADDVVCLTTPEPFVAVGQWYEDFSPTTDEEVRELLASASREPPRPQPTTQR